MQIVINVPDKTYEYYVKLANKSDEQLSAYERLILNGIPLPKGHGRLIDVDNIQEITLEDSLTVLTHKKGDDINCYIDSPTVLEADKAGDIDDRSRLQKM